MRCEVLDGPVELARRAADVVCRAAERKSGIVLGLPSGSTPIGLYRELTRRARAGEADFNAATAFAIDEFLGIARSHPATNTSYFREHLAAVRLRAVHAFDSATLDPNAECARFEARIQAAGGLDLLVLGIGVNGHIAFNEPGSPIDSRARRVALAAPTRAAYAQAFGDPEDVPAFGLTLGIAELLAARAVLLLASGIDKAEIVVQALEGPASDAVPASALQQRSDATVLLDRSAASRLTRYAAE